MRQISGTFFRRKQERLRRIQQQQTRIPKSKHRTVTAQTNENLIQGNGLDGGNRNKKVDKNSDSVNTRDNPSFILTESKTDPAYLTLQRMIPQDEINGETNIDHTVSTDTVQVHVNMEVVPEQTGMTDETNSEREYKPVIQDRIEGNNKSNSLINDNVQVQLETNVLKNNSKTALQRRTPLLDSSEHYPPNKVSSVKLKHEGKKSSSDECTQSGEQIFANKSTENVQVAAGNKIITKDTSADQTTFLTNLVSKEGKRNEQDIKCKTDESLNSKSTSDEGMEHENGRKSEGHKSQSYNNKHKWKARFDREHGRMVESTDKNTGISHSVKTNKDDRETDSDYYEHLTDWTTKYSIDNSDDSNTIQGVVLPSHVCVTDEEQMLRDYNSQNLISGKNIDCQMSANTNNDPHKENIFNGKTYRRHARLKHSSEPGSSVSHHNTEASSQNKPRSKSECYDDQDSQNVPKSGSGNTLEEEIYQKTKRITDKTAQSIVRVKCGSEIKDNLKKFSGTKNKMRNLAIRRKSPLESKNSDESGYASCTSDRDRNVSQASNMSAETIKEEDQEM